MDRVRIMVIHGITDLSGGERFLIDLLGGLDNSAIQPLVVLPGEGPLTAALRERGERVEMVPMHTSGRWARWQSFLRGVLAVRRLVRRERIQLIHANDLKVGVLARLSVLGLGVPVVWTVHGQWYGMEHWWRRLLVRWCFSRLVCVSEAVTAQFKGLPASLVRQVYLGVDTQRFRPSGRACNDDVPCTVTVIARYDPDKDLDTMLDAAAVLKKQGVPVRMALVGGDFHAQGSGYREAILARREREGLTGMVELWPKTPRVEEVYARTDILLSTSRKEPLGLTVLEAMACGIPVVATRSGGPEETVEDGETGYLVPVGDASAMVERLKKLCTDTPLRHAFGRRGRQRVEEFFSLETMVEQYLVLYRSQT